MDSPRFQRWSTIVGVAVLTPVLYATSFGPACWLASRCTHRHAIFDAAYWPIGWAAYNGRPSVSQPLAWYADLGMPAGARWHLQSESRRVFDSDSFVLVGRCPF